MQDIHPIGTTNTGGAGGVGRVFGGGDRRLRPHSHNHQQALKCPRCDSLNTKFCYYNNYNLSQPRHFCKNCRRYWTKGGVLRNVPVGGGCRKSKRSNSKSKHSLSSKKTPNSHSSSENSNSLSSTSAAANSAASGGGVFQIPPSVTVTAGFEPSAVGGEMMFAPPSEIAGFMSSLMSSDDHQSGFSGGCETAPFSQMLQNHQSSALQDWEGGGAQEGGCVLDPTVRIDDEMLQNRGSNGGLAALDWVADENNSNGNSTNVQGLFDFSSDDHQAYWNHQSTAHHHHHHHHQWSDSNNDPHPLFNFSLD